MSAPAPPSLATASAPHAPAPAQHNPPELVTLHLWTVPLAAVPLAVARMGADRLRRAPGATFTKLLGTGSGRTFTNADADPRVWGLLTCWETREAARAFERSSPVARGWRGLSGGDWWRAELVPVSAHGLWSRREPFGRPQPQRRPRPPTTPNRGTPAGPSDPTGLVAALTRARLKPHLARRFWRAVPPVSADLHHGPGLRFAVGIGEAPVGLQGTFSVWDDATALREFAYGRPAHQQAIEATSQQQWYAEELFARFDVVAASGTVRGRDPLLP